MKLKLTPKLTLIFVLFAAALLGVVNMLVYNSGQTALEAAAIAELESIAEEKQAALDAWLNEGQNDIVALAADPVIPAETAALLTNQANEATRRSIHNKLIDDFLPRVKSGEFRAVLLLDPTAGKVLVATNPAEEGKPKGDRSYFEMGKHGPFITTIYYSEGLDEPAITTATPITSERGELVGILVGRLNLQDLDEIIQRRSGLRQTSDSFLVNTSHQFVTQPRFLADPVVLKKGVYTLPVNLCLEEKSGSIFAHDYRNVPAITVYRWLPDRQMCLIVNISQAEALAQERTFELQNILIGSIALLLASAVAIGLSHTIVRPLRVMQEVAQRYGQGDLSVRLPEERSDELGSLAHEFNTMAASLAEKENRLREHSLELEQRVEDRTAELQHSQKRFQALIENAPDGIALLGLDGKLRQVTPSTEQILGYSMEDAQGQDPALLTHPDDLTGLLEILNDLIQNPGKVVRAEYRFRHKDGSWRWLESTISNLIQEPGLEAIVFNYRDVTERKQAEEALAESEEKFKYIFDHSVVGKSITHIDGTLEVNQAFCDMLGYSREELLGTKWQEITHPEDIELSNRVVELLVCGEKESVRFTKRYLHKTGSAVWGDISLSLRRGPEGKPLYFMTSVVDITERKLAENQLAESLEFTERILTSAPVGILAYKFTGEFVSANAYASQTIEATPEQLRLQNFHELESWKQSGLYDLAQRAMTERTHVAADIHHTTTFGKEKWFSIQLVTFKSRGEDLLLVIVNDITERKQAEDTLRRFELLSAESRDIILFVRSDDGRILEANQAAINAYGYRREELLTLTIEHLRAPETHVQTLDQIAQAEAGGILFETVHLRRDGSTFPAEVSSQGTTIRGVRTRVSIIRDITERKKADLALQEKERLLSEAQHIGQIGSLSYDIAGDRFQFSDEMYHLLDVAPEKFPHDSKEFLALIYPSDRPEAATWFVDLREGWQTKDLDFRLFRRNGELRYLHNQGALEFNSEGKPVRFIGTTQDVTERKLAEIQINQQIKHLTALSEIDRAIITGLDQRETLGVILSQTLSQLQVDAAEILLLDPDGKGLHYAAGQGLHTPLMEKIYVPFGKSFAGRVAQERRLLRIPNLQDQSNDPLFDILVTEEKFVSYVGIPLIVMQEVKGVLEVFHRTDFQPYAEWLDFLNTLAGQASIAIENANLLGNLKASNAELSQAYDATIEGWSHAMDLRDRETEGHTQRVVHLTLEMSRGLGIPESKLPHIRRGALLHDIGKLGIPDRILLKPDKLSSEEWEIMQKHPEYAYEMLSPIQYLKPALPIPYFHHEKWDGSGYPLGLRGEKIPLEARIFAIVDVWDALRSDRPYRKAWTEERTLEYIRSLAGSQFDPTVVDYFMELMNS